MRVALTVPSFAPTVTGPGEAVARIAAGLRERGHEVNVFTFGSGPMVGPGVIGVGRTWADPVVPNRPLADALDRFRPDLVWAHELRNSLTVTAAAWSRRRGVRFALQPHGGVTVLPRLPLRARAAYRALDWLSRMPPKGGHVIATCRAERDALVAAGTDADRIIVLYLGSDGVPAARKASAPPNVLMMANLGFIRDPRLAVRAVREANQAGLEARLTIAGPLQAQSRLVRRAKPRDIRGATYAGLVPPQRRAAAFAEADVFLYPTRYESFGLPLLEAAVAGLPIVAPPEGIVPEVGLDDAGGIAPLPQLGGALIRVLRTLSDAKKAAMRRGRLLQPWASWKRRARRAADWVEDPSGDVAADPPPVSRPHAGAGRAGGQLVS